VTFGACTTGHTAPIAERSALDRVRALVERGRGLAADTAVFVLANLKDHTGEDDVTDVQTEYLSEAELDQLVSGFRGAGFYCDPFTEEAAFCRWAAADGGARFPLSRRAVYTIAQPGRGASRHAPLAGVAQLFGFTLLSPPAYEACLSAHKGHATVLMQAAGVPTPDTWSYHPKLGWIGLAPPDGADVILKPCLESASIGVDARARFRFGDATRHRAAELAEALGQPVLAQAFVPGWEVEVAVLNDGTAFALDPVGISVAGVERLGDGFLDYPTVYRDGYGFFDFAAREPQLAAEVRGHAARAATVLGLQGISRFDFRIDAEGRVFAFDMAGKPHLTRHSSVAFGFATLGLDYSDVFAALVGGVDAAGGFAA